jgi:radical SAM protein with 4Fe4S-binding SPASM domain
MFINLFSKLSFYLSRLSSKKILNLVFIKVSFHLSILTKKHILWGKPAFLSIEPTNVCNLKCPECPTGGGFSNVTKGFATNELITALIPSIKESVLHVNMFFQGEPFLNKLFVDFTKRISPFTFVTVSTNGHFIDKNNAKDIINAGFYKIIISLDGINQEQYEQYRKGGEFDKVIDATKSLVAAKQESKRAFPIIQLQCLLFKHTEPDKDTFQSLAKELNVDRLVFKTAQFYSEENAKEMMPSIENSRYIVENGAVVINHEVKNRCWRLWSSSVITWNGDVVPCCFDKDKKFVQGNVLSTQLFTVWKHPLYASFRAKILLNRKAIDMCNNCSEK